MEKYNYNDLNEVKLDADLKFTPPTPIGSDLKVGDTTNNSSVSNLSCSGTTSDYYKTQTLEIKAPVAITGWGYWQDYYYPGVIRESYPVYIQEKSLDSGKKAFEIIKLLQDKKLMKLDKVKDFIDAMDVLIKVL